ncbi:hypothetical protein RUM43_011110 [Polyplax serrata]|uniref:Uncharacterized protein n=1 Tax=Polyplax serrata TaxID=468196 RepID=A0AAN8NLI3_POLSC
MTGRSGVVEHVKDAIMYSFAQPLVVAHLCGVVASGEGNAVKESEILVTDNSAHGPADISMTQVALRKLFCLSWKPSDCGPPKRTFLHFPQPLTVKRRNRLNHDLLYSAQHLLFPCPPPPPPPPPPPVASEQSGMVLQEEFPQEITEFFRHIQDREVCTGQASSSPLESSSSKDPKLQLRVPAGDKRPTSIDVVVPVGSHINEYISPVNVSVKETEVSKKRKEVPNTISGRRENA